jgi:hypothetical protein
MMQSYEADEADQLWSWLHSIDCTQECTPVMIRSFCALGRSGRSGLCTQALSPMLPWFGPNPSFWCYWTIMQADESDSDSDSRDDSD